MKRKKITQILLNVYSKDSVKSILTGRRRPSLKNIIRFEREHNIPASVWLDIKSYLHQNTTKQKA